MTDADLRLLRDTLEISLAGGIPWLPDTHHRNKQKCLRAVRLEIRARAAQEKINAKEKLLQRAQ